jgi:hypothetical protein
VTWTVAWTGGGQAGTVPGLTTTSTAAIRVVEVQAVVTAQPRRLMYVVIMRRAVCVVASTVSFGASQRARTTQQLPPSASAAASVTEDGGITYETASPIHARSRWVVRTAGS